MRGVSPVIATLLLVAIAVVGGSIIFGAITLTWEWGNDKEFKNWGEGDCERYRGINSLNCFQYEEMIENQERIIELLEGEK